MGNNWVNIILHQRWNLAAARTKHGNAFRDAALMKEFQNQCAYPHSTRECPFWLHLVTIAIRWRGIWPFHHRLLESQSCQESAPGHVAFLPWRDGASYSQATTTTSLLLSVLTFSSREEDIHSFDVNMELSVSQRSFQEVTSGSSVPSSGPNVDFLKVVRMVFWSGVVGLARSRLALTVALRAQKLDLWASLVLMVKVERRNWLTIHIPHSRVTDDIRLKNELGA